VRNVDYFFINSTLCEVLYGGRPKSLFVKLCWLPLWLLEKLTFARIYYWNFSFPIDAKLAMLSFKYYQLLKPRVS
jgi:hypothetical protein